MFLKCDDGFMKNSIKNAWFKDGLAFKCQGCGGCCRGPGGYVWLNEVEAEKFALRLNISTDNFLRKYTRLVNGKLALLDNAAGDCIFMAEGGGCMYYEERPSQCRTFPWWPEVIATKDSWEHSHYECPGIGKGEIHSAEHIISESEKK